MGTSLVLARRSFIHALVLTFVLGGLHAAAAPSDWVLLGKKKLGTKLDRDEISVGLSEGAFRHIRLSVHGRGVEFHKVIVVFGSGEPYEVPLKSYVAPGKQTRVIDLPGKARFIRKVILWYETRSGSKEATVAVWGEGGLSVLSAESRARAIARREAIGGAAGNFVVNAAINVWMLSGKGPHVMSVDSIASTERTLLSAAVPLAVSLSIVVATLTFFQFRKKAAGLDPSIDARLARPYYPIGLANAIGAALTSFGAVVTAAVLWQRAFGSVEVSTLVAALIAGTVAAISALYASLRTTTALLRS